MFVYIKVRLSTPVNEDILMRLGLNGTMDSDEVYSSSAYYMDPNTFTSNICVKVTRKYYDIALIHIVISTLHVSYYEFQ
jgi:hypothetical protein